MNRAKRFVSKGFTAWGMAVAVILALGATAVTAPAATIFIDFGASASPTTGSGWNNVTSTALNTTVSDLASTNGATTIDLKITDAFSAGIGTSGTTSGSAPYPSTATSDFFFEFANNATSSFAQVVLSQLDLATTYSFKFYASRAGVVDGSTRSTTYGVTGLNSGSAALEPSNNITNVAAVDNIVPTAGGLITIDLFRTSTAAAINSSGTILLGVIEITTTESLPEPAFFSLISLVGVPVLMRRRRAAQGI